MIDGQRNFEVKPSCFSLKVDVLAASCLTSGSGSVESFVLSAVTLAEVELPVCSQISDGSEACHPQAGACGRFTQDS